MWLLLVGFLDVADSQQDLLALNILLHISRAFEAALDKQP